MSQIGEIKKGVEIGRKNSQRYVWHACVDCGEEKWVQLRQGKPISLRCNSCAGHRKALKLGDSRRGNLSPSWKGGRFIDNKGYVTTWIHPNDFFYPMAMKNGYVQEHRLIIAKRLGRNLHRWETVHHKNGIRDDNRLENLELSTKSQHITDHHRGYKDGYIKGCQDGQSIAIKELKQQIKLLQWQIKELINSQKSNGLKGRY